MIDIERLHTTPLGEERIRRNLGLGNGDVLTLCRELIQDKRAYILRKGKNWYVEIGEIRLSINMNTLTLTIITVHRM